MGNCFKSGSNDDVSLLRGNYVHPDPSETPRDGNARARTSANAGVATSSQQSQAGPNSSAHGQRRRVRSETAESRPQEPSATVSNSLTEQSPAFESNEPEAQYFYIAPNVRRSVQQLTEEEQIKIAKRIGLISHLPTGLFDGSNENEKQRECIICMCEYVVGDQIRFLPCLHAYHRACVDDWLMRSFTCPSCLEPVDAALLTSYENSSCSQAALVST